MAVRTCEIDVRLDGQPSRPPANAIARACRPLLMVLAVTAAACSASAQVRCEQGGYKDSAEACVAMAHKNSHLRDEAARYHTLAGRYGMWACERLSSPACQTALQALFRHSADVMDQTTAVALSQQACLAGSAEGCHRAGAAAWCGHGVPANAVASLAWHQRCSGCGPWDVSKYVAMGALPWRSPGEADRLERVRELLAAGAHAAASSVLRGMAADTAGRVQALREQVALGRWDAEVTPLQAAGKRLYALALAQELAAQSSAGGEIATRLEHMRREFVARELAALKEALSASQPNAARFHAGRAAGLGAQVDRPTIELDALWRDLPIRPRFVLPVGCDWLRPLLEARYPAAKANVTITGNLACTATAKVWTETQAYTWNEKQEQTKQRWVPGTTTRNQQTCYRQTQPICNTYRNGQTHCTSGLSQSYDCGTTTTTPGRTESYTATVTIPHRGTRQVSRRTLSVAMTGTLDGPSEHRPASYTRVSDESEFNDGHGGVKSFATAGLAQLQASAAVDAIQNIEQILQVTRAGQIGIEMAAAAKATGLDKEEHWLRAMTLGDPGHALAAIEGLTTAQLAVLVNGGRLPVLAVASSPFVAAMPVAVTAGYPIPHYPPRPQRATAVEDTQIWRDAGAVLSKGGDGAAVMSQWYELELGLTQGNRWTKKAAGGAPAIDSSGYGLRLELGPHLSESSWLTVPWLALATGTDDKRGAWLDTRAGAGVGFRGDDSQFLFIGGVGYAGLGARQPGASDATRTWAGDLFYGADLRWGLSEGMAFDTRLMKVLGGPLEEEIRLGSQLVYRAKNGIALGVEGTARLAATDFITSFGLVLSHQPSRRRWRW